MLTHVVLREFKSDGGRHAPGSVVDGDAMLNAQALEAEYFMRRMTPAEFSAANAPAPSRATPIKQEVARA